MCGLALLLGACTSGGADGAAAQTPLATLERALTGPGPIEPVRALDPAGLKWLGVADLRATGPGTRAFVVDALVFDWPIPVRGRLRETDGAWAVESLEPASTWRGRARLVGDPDGAHLPEARSARPTSIGLTGRDTALRPSSAVVVAVWGDVPSDGLPNGLEVDGTPAEPATWTTALASARALREAVASEQHAPATAQVAFAVPTTLPMHLLDRLRQGALEVGFEDHFLLVRRPNGGPGVLSLGRAVPAIAGQHYIVVVKQLVDYRHQRRWDILMEHAAKMRHLESGHGAKLCALCGESIVDGRCLERSRRPARARCRWKVGGAGSSVLDFDGLGAVEAFGAGGGLEVSGQRRAIRT